MRVYYTREKEQYNILFNIRKINHLQKSSYLFNASKGDKRSSDEPIKKQDKREITTKTTNIYNNAIGLKEKEKEAERNADSS